jgi:hypothetical protein
MRRCGLDLPLQATIRNMFVAVGLEFLENLYNFAPRHYRSAIIVKF